MFLGVWGKLLVIAIGAAVVVLVVLIVVCFVGPGCWGYQCLHKEEEEKKKRLEFGDLQEGKKFENVDLADLSSSKRKKSNLVYDSVAVGSQLGRLPHHRDSTYSSMSENSERRSLSFRSMLTEDSAVTTNGTSTCTNKKNPPVLNMSLQFLISEESGTGKLVISIKSVCGLPEKEYSGYLEPYLVVQVMKSTWPLHRRAGAPLFYLRTRTIRHTHNPQFHQTFVLDAAKTHIKDWCMKMTVYDQDRFANHTELYVLNLPLKDIKLLNSNPNPIELSYNLMQSEKEFGELLIGICYLPTAQRLSFSIIKAINLKFLEITESIDTFYPYVRVIQLNGTSARAVKKKKTAYKHATESPNFNETLTFDLAPSQLETATFLVTVSNKNMEEAQPGCADSLIIPEELPSILSLIYANIPPIKKGTDSRVGVGFRLGPHADFQVLLELGPQKETLPLGPNDDSKKRRQIKPILNANQYIPDTVPDTSAGKWLTSWKSGLINNLSLKSNTIPTEEEQTHQEMEVVSHLRQLYSKTEPSKI